MFKCNIEGDKLKFQYTSLMVTRAYKSIKKFRGALKDPALTNFGTTDSMIAYLVKVSSSLSIVAATLLFLTFSVSSTFDGIEAILSFALSTSRT